jgi:hypothetical protein
MAKPECPMEACHRLITEYIRTRYPDGLPADEAAIRRAAGEADAWVKDNHPDLHERAIHEHFIQRHAAEMEAALAGHPDYVHFWEKADDGSLRRKVIPRANLGDLTRREHDQR